MDNLSHTRTIFLNILDIIGYQGDKQTYINDLVALCVQKAFYQALNNLPEQTRTALIDKFSSAQSKEAVEKIFFESINGGDYLHALEIATRQVVGDYIHTVQANLTPEQSERLTKYLQVI